MKDQIFRLGKNAMIYGAGTMLSRFIYLLLLPLFTAYLTPTDYGVLALLALLAMVAHSVFSLGLSAAIGPNYFEGNDTKRKFETVWTAFLILLGSTTILTSIAWLFPRELSMLALQSPEYGPLVSITLLGCAVGILATPFTQRIQFEERAKLFVSITLTTSLIAITLSVVTVIFLGWGVRGIVISQLIGQMSTFLFFFITGSRETRFIYSKTIAKDLLRLGIPFIPSFAFLFILMQSNQYILQRFESLDQVGIYSIGFNIGTALNLVVGALSTAWYPFFMSYRERQKEAEILFGRIFTYYIFFVGYLWLSFFIFAKPVVMFMTQTAFHSAYQVVGMVAGAYFFIGIYMLLLPGMYYRKEVGAQSLVQGIAAFISIIFNVWMVYLFGLFGSGLSLLTGHILMALFTHCWNQYKKKTYIRIQYQWRRLLTHSPIFFVIPMLCLSIPPQRIELEIFISVFCFTILTIFTYINLNKSERLQFSSLKSIVSLIVERR